MASPTWSRMRSAQTCGILILSLMVGFILIRSVRDGNLRKYTAPSINIERSHFLNKVSRQLTDQDLADLYRKYVQRFINEEYLRPYRGVNRQNVERLLPSNIKLNNASRQLSYERFFTMRDFQVWMAKHKISCKRLGSVNGPDPEEQYIQCSQSKTHYEYKENADGTDEKHVDLYTLQLHDHQKMDFWSVQQTFEHIYDGDLVMKRLYDNSQCNGHIFVSVPIYNIPHLLPIHFYGYTPMGMLALFSRSGWTILDMGKW